MIIHEGYDNLNLIAPVVTLGIFDGVHRGHRALLDCLVSKARETGGEAVVITFSPHPRLVLSNTKENLSFLTTMDEKENLLRNAKVDHLIIIEFTDNFSNIRACDFIKEVLVKKIGTRHLVIGYNHHFGSRGEGDFNTIKQCAENMDIVVEQAQGYHTEEGEISSSAIREALLAGKLDEANKWLGYFYSLGGLVIKGRQIGRTIGFPTANIQPGDNYKLVPAGGVYAVEVKLDEKKYHGMLNIGSNPTVNSDSKTRSIEVNILNFDSNIYGRKITIVFRKRLRDEIKFESIDELSRQMEMDKLNTIQLLTR
jgi:riboflavin kinase / FMN adenylyltransferase